MASAWGKSWGAAFGVAWGAIAVTAPVAPAEPHKYYSVEAPKQSQGELLMAQALDEDDAVLAMLQVLIMEM